MLLKPILATTRSACVKLSLAIVAMTSCCAADAGVRVIWEYGIGAVTSGYDVENNRTEIRKWYLGASGPDNIPQAALDYIKNCVEESLTAAGTAAYDTPGEASARLAAAMTVWSATFPACMNGEALANSIKDQFKIGITEQRLWVPGAHLRYMAGQFNAELYNLYYKELDKRLPGGDGADLIRKFALLNAKFEAAKAVDIDIKVPDEISNGASRLVKLETQDSAKLLAGLADQIRLQASPEKIAEAVPQVLNLTAGTVAQIAYAIPNSIQNLGDIISKLPPGPPLPNLGDTVGGDVGKVLNDLTKVPIIPGISLTRGVPHVPNLVPSHCCGDLGHVF